jgi:LysM repeat protein
MKTIFAVCIGVLMLLATGCGVPESDYQQVVSERNALEDKVSSLQKELDSLRELRLENNLLQEKLTSSQNENQILKDQASELQAQLEQCKKTLESKPAPPPPPAAEKPAPRKPAAPAESRYYVVKAGDTLWSISQRTGVPLDVLRKLNGIKDSKIKVGQKLLLKSE